MILADFEEGKTYLVTERPFSPPDGSPVVPGKTRTVKILAPASGDNSSVFNGESTEKPTANEVLGWSEFLRVENQDTHRIHLLHPETVKSAVVV
jgi:hypothetical protein